MFIFQNLATVLEMVPIPFGIRLASLASRRHLIDLENWLSNHLSIYKDNFFEVCNFSFFLVLTFKGGGK